ncbi:hypothetical protein DL93DRAFT_2147213 [Clavulina sp. PMI_390]|nr:hypothetical protein DL93DRAFT_2147213 [Clavulina sp. PMI_390]
MSSAKRPTAPRQARPAQRYFPGKALRGVDAASSDSDSDDAAEQPQLEEGDVSYGGDQLVEDQDDDDDDEVPSGTSRAVTGKAPTKAMNVSLKQVNITDGKVIVAGQLESGRTEVELAEQEEEEEDEDEEEEEEEEESSEEESESEEETRAPAFRPVFVPKRARVTVQEREAEAQNTEEAQAKRDAEAEKRKKESHDLVADSIKRELAEKEVQEAQPDLDDTDGLDPTAEFEEWRLRELGRIKRDKEASLQREEEREEIERRRALPEEQRMAEDLEHAKRTRDDKPKGQQKFLQKYYHKGAFHQDEAILKRDYTEATESTVDVSMLPKVMQVKNFGKRSQTKYTHLLDQDTTRETKPSGSGPPLKDGQGCFNCGGPHLARDCPNKDQDPSRGPVSGANGRPVAAQPGKAWGVKKDMPPPNAPTGPASRRDRDGPPSSGGRQDGGWRDRDSDRRRWDDDGGDRRDRYDDRRSSHRDRSRTPPSRKARPRSRSRSPQQGDQDRHGKSHRRPRSRSPSLDPLSISCLASPLDSQMEGAGSRKRDVKVAIVGSGLAGLAAAHLLSSANDSNDDVHFDVHIFEKASAIGMDAYSIDVKTPDGIQKVDVPMRAFQGGYYPNLIALYRSLGVQLRVSNFSYSFSWLEFAQNTTNLALRPHLIYDGASGRGGISMPSRWFSNDDDAWRATPSKASSFISNLSRTIFFVLPKILVSLLFLFHLALFFLRLHALSVPMLFRQDSTETLAEWTSRTAPSNWIARAIGLDTAWLNFVDFIVVPLFSAVCTAPAQDIYQHPVNEILGMLCFIFQSDHQPLTRHFSAEYVILTLGTNHYVVNAGVQDAIHRITKPIPKSNIHLSSTITSISHDPHEPSTSIITFEGGRSGSSSIGGFEHVILATQANQAIPLLASLRDSYDTHPTLQKSTDAQIVCLRRFKYVPTIVVNHRDPSFLPANPTDVRDLNLVCAPRDKTGVAGSNEEVRTRYKSDEPCLPHGYAMATHAIGRGRKDGTSTILQTTNPIHPPHPDSILSIARIERACLTADAKLAQRDLITVGRGRWLQAPGRLTAHPSQEPAGTESESITTPGIWLVGSYAHPGIPLLEACVNSALAVVENGIFGVEGVNYRAGWAVRC